ncbi:DNA-binding GntR family transcriptional regulator [Lipingzhangella halophila]|uniref:DNA-binding GntR family transcriptional regulator n=1 Tax=Lipingzhangella halophila TaxID=1783352 RepID=A0A7W7RMA1_9ACTN|nr:GntR family transcriptional regulator [Lipingzhangella halophila]MBB4934607.1 DNA-binding GntR family transcriptional regulator [Lipingzhangella halophila]
MSPRATPWGTYNQIAETLRQRITSGTLAPGALVPSEAALGEEFGVARSTVRRALAALESDRLIQALPGTGRVVCDPDEAGAGNSPGHQPQYRRIAAELRDRINRGDLSAGDPLPSESALVHTYGVSRSTARQALSDLEGSGLVVSVHGKGRFVRDEESAER